MYAGTTKIIVSEILVHINVIVLISLLISILLRFMADLTGLLSLTTGIWNSSGNGRLMILLPGVRSSAI